MPIFSPEQNYLSLFAMRYPVCHFPTFKKLISLSRVLLYGRPFTFFVAFNFQSIFCLLSRICQLVQNTLGTIHKGRLLKGVGRWVHQKEIYCIRLFMTSLKIFKHYKLKPSFSIFKDEKAKDKVGVGDKPQPQSFNKLMKFDPIFSSLIQFNTI